MKSTATIKSLAIVKTLLVRAERDYNGWKNYPTWAVKLWLDNDPTSYDFCCAMFDQLGAEPLAERLKQSIHVSNVGSVSSLAMHRKVFAADAVRQLADPERSIYAVAEALRDKAEEHNPMYAGGREADMYTDLMNFGLSWLDYYGHASSYLDGTYNAMIPTYAEVLDVVLEMVDWKEIAEAYAER